MSTITDALLLTKTAKWLKEIYLDAFNNQAGITPSALLAAIDKMPLEGETIVSAAPVGISGGFGFSEEGEETPSAGNQNYERFTINPVDMYTNLNISVKAARLTNNANAFINAVDSEVRAAYKACEWNTGRALFGNGSGKLANVTAAASSGATTIKVDSIKYLKEGLTIDFFESGATTVSQKTARARIKAINRTANSGSYTVTLETGLSAAIAKDGFITCQNSLNRELTGLGALFDTSITTIQGVDRTAQPLLTPKTVSANNDISDTIITRAIRDVENEKGAEIDMILCGSDAYDHYVTYLRESNIRVEDKTGELAGGFKTIKLIFGNRVVNIVYDQFMPDTEMWGVETDSIKFHTSGWDFCTDNGAPKFQLLENHSIYRALLACYGNLVYSKPGGAVRITDCA